MPRRELPPRIQSHLARVRLARIIAISFACLCLIVGVRVAASNTTPGNHVVRALNRTSQRLPQTSPTPAAQPQRRLTQTTNPYAATSSQTAKSPEPDPPPAAGGATASE